MPQKVRRVVTGHDDRGKAIVLFDGPSPHVRVRGHGTASTLLWVTDKTPTEMKGRKDAADREIGVPPPPQGSIFRIVEFPPDTPESLGVRNEDVLRQMGVAPAAGAKPPRHPGMHRTASIDYAVVMSGEIDMLLDDSEVRVKAGDVVVQQGTIHAWANRSKAPCVIAFILIGATPPWDPAGERH
jgi:mannose-6-phosphate isomerase-like protein (cupin superfamily)